ncbi:MAG: hypothetical protein ACK4HE_08290 [Chitinophagaceae bacterium]|jgi:hypothetical protein
MKVFFRVFILLLLSNWLQAQELYVFSEPASNMPAKNIGLQLSQRHQAAANGSGISMRHTAALMLGLNKDWMIHTAVTFSNMYTNNYRFESVRSYTKYRFFTTDGMYKHFRMAAFAEAAYSLNEPMYQEVAFEGDQSGVQLGLIGTQLLHKLAISGTVSYQRSFINEQWSGKSLHYGKHAAPVTQAVQYSLSSGLLVLPKTYTNYQQTNFNVYVELLGQKAVDNASYWIDIAPAIQLIFNSQSKLNVGYRKQLAGTMYRMATESWLVAYEYNWFNALRKKKKH